jgi:UDP-N-acetylmuramoyl-tripeptide--D-alanyl-D-alanine ligase
MRFALSALAAASEARIEGDAESVALTGVAVDSRSIREGDLFVAIRGARVDGHDFALQAAANGARAILGEHRPDGLPAGFPMALCPDPVRALQRFAASEKKRLGFRLAAITGSAGKTTTKDFTAAILGRRFAVEKTPGSQNSQIGFSMSVLNLARVPEWMVGEMGLSQPGELSRLSRAFEPDVAALLLVAPAHLQYFPSVDAIADAKAEILEGLKTGGTFVANADDPRVERIAARRSGRVIRFGIAAADADVRARDLEIEADASRFRLETPSGSAAVRLPLPGAHQVANFLAAAAIAFALGLGAEDSAATAPDLRPAAHRGEWRLHASGARLYDDAYNANPSSMRAALETLGRIGARRRIAVLGDMLELGADEEEWHRGIGRLVPGRADRLVAVGERARWIAEGAVEAGMAPGLVERAEDASGAARLLAGSLEAGDVALFKASRGIGLERAVASLAGEG